MRKRATIILFFFGVFFVTSQKNCNVFKWDGDLCRYEACTYIENAPKYFQLRKEYQEIYNKALEICPDYSDAYRAKSVAYLKTGDFVIWKQLMDKAVEINPEEHLAYRGWCRFQFFRDYEGAIGDIERLEKIAKGDIGYSQNGTYHLKVTKALCYKMLGKAEKAIKIIETHINSYEGGVGLYDSFHLGVLYFETKNYAKALIAFNNQITEYSHAENFYYMGLNYKALGNKTAAETSLIKAKTLYSKSRVMFDPYTHQVDKIYLSTIDTALGELAL